jgi:HD-like signal output (HDOD) protein
MALSSRAASSKTAPIKPIELEGRVSEKVNWREVVAWVSDLPPMPQVAAKALSMVENPTINGKDLADVLLKDPALAARILKIANSAMFSRQREITTLIQAIMIIGVKAIKGIIVAASLRQMSKSMLPVEKLIWENSMFSAIAASTLAKKFNKKFVDEIFLLALLHSLGQIVLVSNEKTAKHYAAVLTHIKEQRIGYMEAEQEVYGFSHPLIGALVAKKWNFSEDTCNIILHYKNPIEKGKPVNEHEEKIGFINFSDLLSHFFGIGSPEGYPETKDSLFEVAAYIGFDPKKIEEEVSAVGEELKEKFQSERHAYE